MSFMHLLRRTRKMYSLICRGQLTNHEMQSANGEPRSNSDQIHKSILFFFRSACSWNLWCNIVVSSRQCNGQQVCIHCQAQCSQFMFVTIWCACFFGVRFFHNFIDSKNSQKIHCSTRDPAKMGTFHALPGKHLASKFTIKYKHFYKLQCVNAILFSRAQCDSVLRKIDSSEEWWLYVNWFISLLCFFRRSCFRCSVLYLCSIFHCLSCW